MKKIMILTNIAQLCLDVWWLTIFYELLYKNNNKLIIKTNCRIRQCFPMVVSKIIFLSSRGNSSLYGSSKTEYSTTLLSITCMKSLQHGRNSVIPPHCCLLHVWSLYTARRKQCNAAILLSIACMKSNTMRYGLNPAAFIKWTEVSLNSLWDTGVAC